MCFIFCLQLVVSNLMNKLFTYLAPKIMVWIAEWIHSESRMKLMLNSIVVIDPALFLCPSPIYMCRYKNVNTVYEKPSWNTKWVSGPSMQSSWYWLSSSSRDITPPKISVNLVYIDFLTMTTWFKIKLLPNLRLTM